MTFPQEWVLLLMEAEQAGQKRGAKAERERILRMSSEEFVEYIVEMMRLRALDGSRHT